MPALRLEGNRFAIRREFEIHKWQMRRVVGSSGGRRKSRSQFGVVKSRLARPPRRVKHNKLASLPPRVAKHKPILRQPFASHVMKHERPRVVSHEFFSPLVILSGKKALSTGIGLLPRRWDRHAQGN